MKKTFRICFAIQELMDDTFLNIFSEEEVCIGKIQVQESFKKAYDSLLDFIERRIPEED